MNVKWMNCGLLLIKKTLDESELQSEYGRTWIWTALDSDTRLIICYLVGDRTLDSCRTFLKELSCRVDNMPLFTSDELVHYQTVLGEIYSEEVPVVPTGKRGRPKNPDRKIDTELDYAVVHKTREKGKVVKVERRIIYGDEQRIDEKIAKSPGKKINTSYIERSNGTLRQNNSHLRRKSLTFAKEMPYFKARTALTILIYNCIRPHYTLSKNKDKTYTPRTPALVAKLIDKNWTIEQAYRKPYILYQ
jgi:IS1 family transposase